MATKKKTKSKSRRSSGSSSAAAVHSGLEMHTKVLLVIGMVALFLVGLIMADAMSRAMASVIVNSYTRQVTIGTVEFGPDSGNVIGTGVATSTFSGVGVFGNQIKAVVPIYKSNFLSYQAFYGETTTSTGGVFGDPSATLTDVASLGCTTEVAYSSISDLTVEIMCDQGSGLPEAGDQALVRYYYIVGPAIGDSQCGNGIWEPPSEVCDDGSLNGSPGYCDSDCQGWVLAVCGNTIVESGELCDDGNWNGTPGMCNQTCDGYVPGESPVCGNGVLENGEFCDDGPNNGQPGFCNSTCTGSVTYCGDGIVGVNEVCDDGSLNGIPGNCNLFCSGYTTTRSPGSGRTPVQFGQ